MEKVNKLPQVMGYRVSRKERYTENLQNGKVTGQYHITPYKGTLVELNKTKNGDTEKVITRKNWTYVNSGDYITRSKTTPKAQKIKVTSILGEKIELKTNSLDDKAEMFLKYTKKYIKELRKSIEISHPKDQEALRGVKRGIWVKLEQLDNYFDNPNVLFKYLTRH